MIASDFYIVSGRKAFTISIDPNLMLLTALMSENLYFANTISNYYDHYIQLKSGTKVWRDSKFQLLRQTKLEK